MAEPFTTSIGALSQGVGVLEKIGILDKIKSKLVNNPDIAASKLAGVLNEIGKTYEAVDDVLVQFSSMSFEDEHARQSALILLNKTRGGHLERRMMDARAKCTQIWVLYDRYLRGWFSRALAPEEQLEINQLFVELATVDGKWIEMLHRVALDLEKFSETMIQQLEENKIEDARQLRKSVLAAFRSEQSKLSAGIITLQEMKLEFSMISGGAEV